MQYKPGMIVWSDAGHDQNCFYVVVAVGEGYVYIADGKRRKVENPKRKNSIHIKRTSAEVPVSDIDTNKKIRRVLRDFNDAAAPVAE